MSPASLTATAAHRGMVLSYFKTLPARILERGSALWRQGAVKRLWRSADGHALQAAVQGGARYRVLIHFGQNQVKSAECSCPYEDDCKHAVAVLLTYNKGWAGPGADPVKDADWTRDSVSPKEPVVRQTTAKTKPSSTKPARKPGPGDSSTTLAAVIEAKSGRKLNAIERKITQVVDGHFLLKKPVVSMDLLLTIAGRPISHKLYFEPSVTLWSARRPPATITEAWYYFAHALKNHRFLQSADSFLVRLAPWADVERVVVPWKREESISEWLDQLATFNELPEKPVRHSPSFRLRLDADGGQIEILPTPSGHWAPVKATPLRTHAREARTQYYQTEDHPLDEAAIRFLRAACPSDGAPPKAYLEKDNPEFIRAANTLLRSPAGAGAIVAADGKPVTISALPAAWSLEGPHFAALDTSDPAPADDLAGDYTLALRLGDGTPIPHVLAVLSGHPNLALTSRRRTRCRARPCEDPSSCQEPPFPSPPSRARPGWRRWTASAFPCPRGWTAACARSLSPSLSAVG